MRTKGTRSSVDILVYMRTFREFKDGIDPATDREVVGIAVYYLQSYGGEDVVSATNVRDLFNINGISMSESIIATHLYNLKENGLLRRVEREWHSGYMLTPKGTRKFERREAGERIGSPPPEDVDKQKIEEQYEDLYEEAQGIRTELEMVRASSQEWRRKSWVWRAGTFLIGAALGVFSVPIFDALKSLM